MQQRGDAAILKHSKEACALPKKRCPFSPARRAKAIVWREN